MRAYDQLMLAVVDAVGLLGAGAGVAGAVFFANPRWLGVSAGAAVALAGARLAEVWAARMDERARR